MTSVITPWPSFCSVVSRAAAVSCPPLAAALGKCMTSTASTSPFSLFGAGGEAILGAARRFARSRRVISAAAATILFRSQIRAGEPAGLEDGEPVPRRGRELSLGHP